MSLAWAAVAAVTAVLVVWFATNPGYDRGAITVAALGLALAGAIAVAAWPRTKETLTAAGLAGLALTAIATGAAIAALGGNGPPEPQPPPQAAPDSLPDSGPTLEVWNKVTDGAKLMREDGAHPAYLSTVTRTSCKDAGCAISDTDVRTGDTVGPAICQGRGDRTTNGDNTSDADDNNPGLYTSNRWYGVLRDDGTIGYISEVWIHPRQREGLGLPRCPHAV